MAARWETAARSLSLSADEAAAGSTDAAGGLLSHLTAALDANLPTDERKETLGYKLNFYFSRLIKIFD